MPYLNKIDFLQIPFALGYHDNFDGIYESVYDRDPFINHLELQINGIDTSSTIENHEYFQLFKSKSINFSIYYTEFVFNPLQSWHRISGTMYKHLDDYLHQNRKFVAAPKKTINTQSSSHIEELFRIFYVLLKLNLIDDKFTNLSQTEDL